jgi:predicted secreted protein
VAGIWLMFQPLGRLFGAFEREGTISGILINSNHPVSLQRFTAAHEYGHYVLGHDSHFDAEEQIEEPNRTETEAAAQAFAADFLMPLQLVNFTLRRLGLPIKQPKLNALIIYRLSLELGASYAATISQLFGLKKISYENAMQLRKIRPLAIKEKVGGDRPRHPWADVWLLDRSQAGTTIAPRLDDEVHVILDETPSTGYLWSPSVPSAVSSEHGIELIRQSFEAADGDESGMIGGTGTHQFVFCVTQPGMHTLRIIMARPWQPDRPESVFEAHVDAQVRVTGASDRGLTERQKRLLLSSAAE